MPAESESHLFQSSASDEQLNDNFVAVRDRVGYAPARAALAETFETFTDTDGNFVEKFQTDGFDARIWELYLHAVLEELGFRSAGKHERPDFIVQKDEQEVCIEATTANPTAPEHLPPDSDARAESADTIRHLQENLVPIKLGSALYSKLQKRYWELPHVAGNPLVVAIEDFHSPISLAWSGQSLYQYLYATRATRWYQDEDGTLVVVAEEVETHVAGEKEIPSGFFDLHGAEHVSAVLFSNAGTISKFNRMGFEAGVQPDGVVLLRVGTAFNHGSEAALPRMFKYKVGERERSCESWREGVTIYHNPRADTSLDRGLFPDVAHFWWEGERPCADIPDFHPMGSVTLNFQPSPPD